MEKALKSLPYIVNKDELSLLINVWLYYDPTDFPTRDLIHPIFIKNKKISIAAIEYRIKHKKNWESKDSLSDLIALEDELK